MYLYIEMLFSITKPLHMLLPSGKTIFLVNVFVWAFSVFVDLFMFISVYAVLKCKLYQIVDLLSWKNSTSTFAFLAVMCGNLILAIQVTYKL